MFFDAPSDILLSLHDARPDILVCFDDDVAVTVFEKNKQRVLSRGEVGWSSFLIP